MVNSNKKSVSVLLSIMMVLSMVVTLGTSASFGAAAASDTTEQVAATVSDGAIVALKNSANWSTPSVHYWKDSNTSTAWPGTRLTDADKDSEGNYVFFIPASHIGPNGGVVFNGTNSPQSADLKIALGESKIYDNSTASWTDYDTSVLQLKVETDVATPQFTETDIVISANASGGSGTYTYKYYVNSTLLKETSEKSVVWTPTAAGTYTIKVVASDTDGNENEKTISYVIKDDSAEVSPVLKGISPVAGSSIKTGQKATVEVKASGGMTGTNLLFYKVAVKDPSGKDVNTVYYKTSNKLEFTPSVAGTYKVEVSVQNSANKTVTKTYELVSSGSVITTTPPTTTVPKPTTAKPTTAKPTAPTTTTTTPPVTTVPDDDYVLGDVDGDGVVLLKDVLFLQNRALLVDGYQDKDMTAKQKLAADVNKDGRIDSVDAVMIQQSLVGMRVLEK